MTAHAEIAGAGYTAPFEFAKGAPQGRTDVLFFFFWDRSYSVCTGPQRYGARSQPFPPPPDLGT